MRKARKHPLGDTANREMARCVCLSVCNRTVITVDALQLSRPLILCLVSPGLSGCELSIDCSHAGRVSFNRRATSESPCSEIRPDY